MEDSKQPVRKLVKARVLPALDDGLRRYADRTHRTVSSAAEHLIAIGLRAEAQGIAGQLLTTPATNR